MGGETCQTSQPPSHSPSLKTWEDHHICLVFILGGGAHLKMYYGAGPVGVAPPVNVTSCVGGQAIVLLQGVVFYRGMFLSQLPHH